MRRTATWTAVAMLVLASSGCGNEPGRTQTEAPSNSRLLEVCDAVDPDTLERLSDGRTSAESVMDGLETFVGCNVGNDSSFEFGVRVMKGDRSLAKLLGDDSRPLSGLGDEAFVSTRTVEGEIAGEQIVARSGGVVVYVRNDLLLLDPDLTKATDAREVASSLLDLSPEDVAAIRPLAVAGPCPTVERVEDFLGPVGLARGGVVEDELTCSYLSDDLVRIEVGRYFDGPDYMPEDDQGDPIEIRGATDAVVIADRTAIEIAALVNHETLWFAVATDRRGALGAAAKADMSALIEELISAE